MPVPYPSYLSHLHQVRGLTRFGGATRRARPQPLSIYRYLSLGFPRVHRGISGFQKHRRRLVLLLQSNRALAFSVFPFQTN
jgi:hypothetical protein